MDNILDKLERGERPTRKELREAGICLACEGYGYTVIQAADPYEEDEQVTCKKCGGTGYAVSEKTGKGA